MSKPEEIWTDSSETFRSGHLWTSYFPPWVTLRYAGTVLVTVMFLGEPGHVRPNKRNMSGVIKARYIKLITEDYLNSCALELVLMKWRKLFKKADEDKEGWLWKEGYWGLMKFYWIEFKWIIKPDECNREYRKFYFSHKVIKELNVSPWVFPEDRYFILCSFYISHDKILIRSFIWWVFFLLLWNAKSSMMPIYFRSTV